MRSFQRLAAERLGEKIKLVTSLMRTQATSDKKTERRRSVAANVCGIEFQSSDLPLSISDVRREVTVLTVIPA